MNEATRQPEHEAATILVVDDNRLSARKLQMATRALGHATEVAVDGFDALKTLRDADFDIVLLDIMMPGMDGYAVLEAMKSDDRLRDVPVIVISSLDEEVGSVARAIELGAEDFLPKDFETALLRARINASLVRKRFRDRELAYFRDIEQLASAAQVIERGAFQPSDLLLENVAARRDPLGRLARVFQDLAEEIYNRERRLDLTVRTLRGAILVLLAGSIFGLAPALGRIAAERSIPPIDLAVWSNLVAGIAILSVSVFRNGLPRLRLRHLAFLSSWAILLGCLYQLGTLVIATHVEATMIALIGSTRGFIVFLLAALIGMETPSLRRFLGLGIGFAAITATLLVLEPGASAGSMWWMLAALALPLLLALHTLLMAWRPKDLSAGATVGCMMILASVLLMPITALDGGISVPFATLGAYEAIVLLLGLATGVALVLALTVVAMAGPVFASQMAYSQTLAGIVWGMLLLGESLSPLAWAALALVILGFWLVEPKNAGSEFKAKLRVTQMTKSPE
ncbi:MAG TPA: response regulator [Alphaproteobacteria bacterium]|nr:response regulator [Alphaproteobacteria bacterium]